MDRNIIFRLLHLIAEIVAPLTGSVDRNVSMGSPTLWTPVAPLTGSVDRNDRQSLRSLLNSAVAPLTGSVDRNEGVAGDIADVVRVAPLTGSVDRNVDLNVILLHV